MVLLLFMQVVVVVVSISIQIALAGHHLLQQMAVAVDLVVLVEVLVNL
tara:strand:+ start:317 stop:460 length:144 start_codon:yes stop_codon:yes gene_type:complete